MGRVGDCHDNAIEESFFATLECELNDRKPSSRFVTRVEARKAIFRYIDGFTTDVDDIRPWVTNRRWISKPTNLGWQPGDEIESGFENFPRVVAPDSGSPPLEPHGTGTLWSVVSNCLCPPKWGNLMGSAAR